MSAVLSPCGRYRYRLERDVGMDGPTYAYFGVNPSTADANVDDATVRKWIGFTRVFGGRRFIVGNVSPVRSTDVRGLASIPVSPREAATHLEHLKQIAADADILVPCWGNRSKAPRFMHDDFDLVLRVLGASGKPVRTFGLTKSGDPKHPLMLGYDTELQPWAG